MTRHLAFGSLLLAGLCAICQALTPPPIYCLAAAPDGKMIAANIGGGPGIAVFDLQSGQKRAQLESTTPEGAKAREAALPMLLGASWVRQIKFTPDAKCLYCTTYEQTAAIIIWDTARFRRPLFIKADMYANFDNVTLSLDAKQWLAFMRTSPNGTDFLLAFDVATGNEIWRRSVGADKVRTAQFSASGDAVLLISNNGSHSWQDPKTGQPLPEPTDKPPATQSAPTAPIFQIETLGKQLKITNLATKQEALLDAKGEIKASLLTSNNLVVAEVSQGLRVWDPQTGKLLYNLGDPDAPPPKSIFDDSDTVPPSLKP